MSWYNPLDWFGVGDSEDKAKQDSEDLYGTSRPLPAGAEQAVGADGNTRYVDYNKGTSWSKTADQLDPNEDMQPGGYGMGGADPRDYMYGRDPNAANTSVDRTRTIANQGIVQGQQAVGAGDLAAQTGQNLLGQRTGDAAWFEGRGGPQGDWATQNGTLGALTGLEATQGPSAAASQLQAGTNAALGSQIALARSGRGFGGGAAAAGLAAGNVAGIQANQANSAATLRAQEDAAWRQRQAANLGTAAGMQGQQESADLAAGLTARGQNDQAALGALGLGQQGYFQGAGVQQQGYGTGLQGTAAGLSGEQVVNQTRGMEMQGGAQFEDNQLRKWAAQNGFNLNQQQMQDQKDAGYANMAATGASALLMASDIRAKKNIVPSDQGGTDFARGLDFDGTLFRPRQLGGYDPQPDGARTGFRSASAMPARPTYDTTAEPAMTPMQAEYLGKPGGGEGQGGAPAAASDFPQPNRKPLDTTALDDAASLDAVRNSPASFYDYKDPQSMGANHQRNYGPMAQDLAKTPAGASAVVQQPDGSLGVDTGRLALVHNGAISAQQKQLDALQAQLDAFKKQPGAAYPSSAGAGAY